VGGVVIWLAVAAAQDAPAPVPDPPPEPAPYEITVWGDLAVKQARDTIVREIEGHGWRVVRRGDGETVFRTRPRWKGKITLTDEGALTFDQPLVVLAPTPVEQYTQDPRYEDVTTPDPLRDVPAGTGAALGPVPVLTVQTPTKRKLQFEREALARDVADEIEAFLVIKRRTAFEDALLGLPDRLDALWTDGTPIEPGPVLPTPEARRRAVLEYRSTRTDTPEGRRTAEVTDDWLAAVVQSSPHPITPAERAEFDARTPDRPLP
jgi:hypothetical protein